MVAVSISGSGDGDGGRGRGGSSGNSGNRDNSDGSGRNGVDWEVEWIKGMDSEETMLAMVELEMGVTVEDI
jgi:hypothetical protein